jgi:hypothetical protein
MRKDQLVERLAELIGVETPKMSTGSTSSKEIFLSVNEILGLGLDPSLTKPELAKGIVEASGKVWPPSCESAGGTVTREGLSTVLESVKFFLKQD